MDAIKDWLIRLGLGEGTAVFGVRMLASLSGLTRILSSLTRREAVFVGEAAALPSRIKIKELSRDQLPDSSDISFVDGWTNELLESKDIGAITNKWTGQGKE